MKPVACLLFLALTAASTDVAAQSLTLEPFAYQAEDGRQASAERGRFRVPENRNDPASREIEIGFVRLKSTAERPGAPIVYLAGGPGGSGVRTLDGPRQPVFMALRDVADVILLDQRGIGLSDAIPDCEAEAAFDADQPLTEATYTAYVQAALDRCVAIWREAGVDIRGYTTVESADDLEALRRALGAERLNLMGISYGTHLGLAMMRRHPQSVDRVVLASVEGMGQTVKSPAALDAALERIAAAEPGAAEPLTAVMRRVHSAFAAPRAIPLRSPDGPSAPLMVDAFPIRLLAGFLAKNPSGIGQLRAFYDGLDKGDGAMAAGLIHQFLMAGPHQIDGMPQAMDIASGVSADAAARFRREAETALLGLATNFPMPQLDRFMPGLDLGDGFREEVVSVRPALIISGDLDLRTPLEEQAAAVAGLSDRRTLLVRGGGHDLFEADPRIGAAVVDFFAGRPGADREIVLR